METTMTNLTITDIFGCTPAPDGRNVSVSVEFDGGERRQILFPFADLDWLAHGLFVAVTAAREAQSHAGLLPISDPPAVLEALIAQALPSEQHRGVLLQISAKELSTRHAALSSFVLSKAGAEDVAMKLLGAASKI
jgi:hypothetical protein